MSWSGGTDVDRTYDDGTSALVNVLDAARRQMEQIQAELSERLDAVAQDLDEVRDSIALLREQRVDATAAAMLVSEATPVPAAESSSAVDSVPPQVENDESPADEDEPLPPAGPAAEVLGSVLATPRPAAPHAGDLDEILRREFAVYGGDSSSATADARIGAQSDSVPAVPPPAAEGGSASDGGDDFFARRR